MLKRFFKTNNSQRRVMIQCASPVNKDAVRRESINGVEHIIVSAFTLPDDVVMNGGLYPADEIAKSFHSLERTLAPVEHPTDSSGNFISAFDPEAIHNFHAGAFNTNVRQEDGRIAHDFTINVQEALKSELGKRLLDRIEELETNENPRPVHSSVGVFLNVEDLSEPKTNAAGDEYTWVASNMDFDHNAILLDSVGAAQPSQGVGMAVNAAGDKFDVEQIGFGTSDQDDSFIEPQPARDSRTNQSEMSFTDIREAIGDALEAASFRFDWIDEIFEDSVIFWSGDRMFTVPYTLDMTSQRATIVGIPVEVERSVTFTPKANKEGDAMKELMLKALAAAGVTVNADISDADLLAQYNALQANQSEGDDNIGDNNGLAEVVANAVAQANQPLVDKMKELETKMNAGEETELNNLAEIVGNSDSYAGIDAEAAKKLPLETLKGMAANCQQSFGIAPGAPINNSEQNSVKTEMPG